MPSTPREVSVCIPQGEVIGFTWRTSCGEHDYVRLLCSTRAYAGECVILSGPPSFPVVTGNLVSLCEQQFADCDATDPGCNGDVMDNTLRSQRRRPSAPKEVILTRRKCQVGIPQGGMVVFTDVATDSIHTLEWCIDATVTLNEENAAVTSMEQGLDVARIAVRSDAANGPVSAR